MKKLFVATALAALLIAGVASATMISGTDLSGLTYRGIPAGDALYVPAAGPIPALAALSTPDSGTSGDAPVVYVRAANVGLPSLGTLNTLSASYHLYGATTGPSGTAPYWLTYLYAPGGSYVGVITMGGPDLNGSSQIHVIYVGNDPNPHTTDTYWGTTLSTLNSTSYNGTTTFGQLTVYETGVEIGNWDNGSLTIPASANIDSITVSSVPIPAAFWLLGSGLLGLIGIRRRFRK
jgi:hypothetical protein